MDTKRYLSITIVLATMLPGLTLTAVAQDKKYCAKEPFFVAMDGKTTFEFDIKNPISAAEMSQWGALVIENNKLDCSIHFLGGLHHDIPGVPAGKMRMKATTILQSWPSQIEFSADADKTGRQVVIWCAISYKHNAESLQTMPKALENTPLGVFLDALKGSVTMTPGLAPDESCGSPASAEAPAPVSDGNQKHAPPTDTLVSSDVPPAAPTSQIPAR